MRPKAKTFVYTAIFMAMMLTALLPAAPMFLGYAQTEEITFTSGERISFTTDTEMSFTSDVSMAFGSDILMTFGTNILVQFTELIPDAARQLYPCELVQILGPPGIELEVYACSWWEIIDPATGNPTGLEFHLDFADPPYVWHVDQVLDHFIPVNFINYPTDPIWAKRKIDIIAPCEYYEVHWPSGWYPEYCSWWEIIDPETMEYTGIEFHVDWTNESCEFHIDEVIYNNDPVGGVALPYPWYEVWARKKITGVKPCDYFVVDHPIDWYPEPCTWWEILDPLTGEPTGYNFHVDWTNESCEFHVDMVHGPAGDPEYFTPYYWGEPYLWAWKKVENITSCDWYIVTNPLDLPDSCTWWEILDGSGAPTGLEFHVDVTDGFTAFHIDETAPDIIIQIPPTLFVTTKLKIDNVEVCDWFKVADPANTPVTCTWWEVIDPDTGNPTGWEFHVDQFDDITGLFHIDNVIPGPSALAPKYEYWAEKKIDTVEPCDQFEILSGVLPAPCSWWEIISPSNLAGIKFHVDTNDGDTKFHVDYVEPDAGTITPPTYDVTAVPYEPPPPPWYKKPPYPDYAPSGVPDFDQKQPPWGPSPGIFTWCGPVAAANSMWWLNAEYTYLNEWPWLPGDPLALVNQLAFLMDTDSLRTGLGHIGTKFGDVGTGISQWFQQFAVTPLGDCDGDGDVDDDDIDIISAAWGTSPGMVGWDMRADVEIDNVINALDLNLATLHHGAIGEYNITTVEYPDFFWIEDEIYRCEDVVLFLEFWFFDGIEWIPLYDNPSLEYGHFVTCAGVNSTTLELLLSDPISDAREAGFPGHIPVPHPAHPADPTVHNDALYVSHDAYGVTPWMGPPPPGYLPVPLWELVNYLQQLGYQGPFWHAFIRAAIATSPRETKYFPWDVTGDDYVGIDDIVAVAEHFGTAPGHPDWDPKYDINKDDYVGIDDIVSVAEHFGQQDP